MQRTRVRLLGHLNNILIQNGAQCLVDKRSIQIAMQQCQHAQSHPCTIYNAMIILYHIGYRNASILIIITIVELRLAIQSSMTIRQSYMRTLRKLGGHVYAG